MKIEMGESLFYSWLRHVKECQIVQTNWKASPQWQLQHEDKLIEIATIKEKQELCLACERNRSNIGEAKMYSDNWLKQGCTSGNRIKVSDTVDYQVWSDNAGAAVGVTVDFETADDFHYELLIADWHRFLKEVLSVTDTTASREF